MIFLELSNVISHCFCARAKENKNALIQEIIADIININHYIYFLNPEACILEIGLDIPKLFQSKSGDFEIEIIRNWLLTLNEHLKRALGKEDIAYITGYSSNNMKRKQMILAQEIIKALANKLPNQMMHLVSKSIQQEFTNQGLEGMLKQEWTRIEKTANMYNITNQDFYYNKMRDHLLTAECYQKTLIKSH